MEYWAYRLSVSKSPCGTSMSVIWLAVLQYPKRKGSPKVLRGPAATRLGQVRSVKAAIERRFIVSARQNCKVELPMEEVITFWSFLFPQSVYIYLCRM